MATKDEVKGVTAHRPATVVIPKPDNPKRQFMTYDEAKADSEKYRKANAAADEARSRVMAEGMEEDSKPAKNKVSPSEAKINELREELAAAEKALAAKPSSKPLQKKVKEISEALEVAEAEAE